MPCDAVYGVTLDLGKTNFDVLLEAVQTLEEFDKKTLEVNKEKKTISFQWKYGKVDIDQKRGSIRVDNGQEESVNRIKRQYTKTVLEKTAKKYGWVVRTVSAKGQEAKKFVLAKR